MSACDDAMRDSGRLAEMSYGNRAIEAADLWRAIERRDLRALTEQLYEPQQLGPCQPTAQRRLSPAGLGTAEAGDLKDEI